MSCFFFQGIVWLIVVTLISITSGGKKTPTKLIQHPSFKKNCFFHLFLLQTTEVPEEKIPKIPSSQVTFWLSFWKITYFPFWVEKICCFQTDLGSFKSLPPTLWLFLGSIIPRPLGSTRYNRQPLGSCTLAQLRCKSPKRVTSAPLNCNIGLSTSIDEEDWKTSRITPTFLRRFGSPGPPVLFWKGSWGDFSLVEIPNRFCDVKKQKCWRHLKVISNQLCCNSSVSTCLVEKICTLSAGVVHGNEDFLKIRLLFPKSGQKAVDLRKDAIPSANCSAITGAAGFLTSTIPISWQSKMVFPRYFPNLQDNIGMAVNALSPIITLGIENMYTHEVLKHRYPKYLSFFLMKIPFSQQSFSASFCAKNFPDLNLIHCISFRTRDMPTCVWEKAGHFQITKRGIQTPWIFSPALLRVILKKNLPLKWWQSWHIANPRKSCYHASKNRKNQSSKQESTTMYQQLTNKYRSFQPTLKKEKLTTNCLTSSSFLLFSPSSSLLGPIKNLPRNLPFTKRESRQGTWTRGKGVFVTKVGEVGSVKCTMNNEALVKIQIFLGGFGNSTFPAWCVLLFVHVVCFFWHDTTYKKWVHTKEVSNLGQVTIFFMGRLDHRCPSTQETYFKNPYSSNYVRFHPSSVYWWSPAQFFGMSQPKVCSHMLSPSSNTSSKLH